MVKFWLTWHEGSVEGQGDHGPKVIPPEHALLDTEANPSKGDQTRHNEERQGGIYNAQKSARAQRGGGMKHRRLKSAKVGSIAGRV